MDIAIHQQNGPVVLREIAARQGISEKYLWQVINPLKAAGIVNAVRGARGGYTLGRDPGEITLLELVMILEGPVFLVDCVEEENCARRGTCVARSAWGRVGEAIKAAMRAVTLKELVDQEKERQSRASLSYVI